MAEPESQAVSPGAPPVSPEAIASPAELARYIDHTLLKPDATGEEIARLAREALKYGFAGVCVNSAHVETAARIVAGTTTVAVAVVGFPFGAVLPSAKAFEASEAVRCGAREIDMVINIGALKAKDYARVLEDIAAVVESASPFPVKVILETSELSTDQKIAGCVLAKAAGAAFVKTSTGFSRGGATAEDVSLMRRIVGDEVGVKASGGIRSAEDAVRMLRAGASRLGTSASVAIVTEGSGERKS